MSRCYLILQYYDGRTHRYGRTFQQILDIVVGPHQGAGYRIVQHNELYSTVSSVHWTMLVSCTGLCI